MKIVAYYNTARHHKKEKKIIDKQFIFKYSNLLSEEHRKDILKKNIYKCDSFIKRIQSYKTTNTLLTRTRTEKSQRKPIVHSNTTLKNDQVIPPPAGGGRGAPGGGRGCGRGAYQGGRGGGTGQGK